MNNYPDDKSSEGSLTRRFFDEPTCRRRNYVQAAYVDASLTIRDLYDLRRAENILRGVDVPMAVIARVLLSEGSSFIPHVSHDVIGMLAAVTVELPTGGFGRRGYRYVTGWALGAGKLSAELGSPPNQA